MSKGTLLSRLGYNLNQKAAKVASVIAVLMFFLSFADTVITYTRETKSAYEHWDTYCMQRGTGIDPVKRLAEKRCKDTVAELTRNSYYVVVYRTFKKIPLFKWVVWLTLTDPDTELRGDASDIDSSFTRIVVSKLADNLTTGNLFLMCIVLSCLSYLLSKILAPLQLCCSNLREANRRRRAEEERVYNN